jgi:hypothetical protein
MFHNEEPFDETTMLDDIETSARPSSEAAWAGITEPHHAGAAVPADGRGARQHGTPGLISPTRPRHTGGIITNHYSPRKKK